MSKNTSYEFIDSKIHYFDDMRNTLYEIDHIAENDQLELRESQNLSIDNKKYHLIIGISMYNEDLESISTTLEGIDKNINSLIGLGLKEEKILIIIICDGRVKLDKHVFEKFIGNNINSLVEKFSDVLLENFEKKVINKNKDSEGINVHEERINFNKYKNMDNEDQSSEKNKKEKNYLISCMLKRKCISIFNNQNKESYLNILFSIKELNKGKLDSHFWLFMGFCKNINPKYVILIDTGTKPQKAGLSSLISPMMKDTNLAGTCGEIMLSNPTNCTNFVLGAQILEYKYSHVVDKNFESLFGFISVLPGAFSAYRWDALNNNETLAEYFRTIESEDVDCIMANRYLAEDRIFCFVLFCLKNKSYILKYIPDAMAETDAPSHYGEFMLQRRRWINGSNFALYYVLSIYSRVWNTKHCIRQIFILILFIYYALQAILGYFILGTFYFVYYMICNKNFAKNSIAPSLIMSIYLFVVIFCMITSMTVKPKRELIKKQAQNQTDTVIYTRSDIYKILTLILGMYNLIGFFMGVYTVLTGGIHEPTQLKSSEEYIQIYKEYIGAVLMAALGIANFLLPLLFEPSMIGIWINNFIQYLFFQPTYAIILNVFAICNIDDVSWGNRDSKSLENDSFKLYKIKILFVWLILNFLQGYGFSYIVTNEEMVSKNYDKMLINYYSYLIAGLTAFKLISAIIGKVKYLLIDKKVRGILCGREEDTEIKINSNITNNKRNEQKYKNEEDQNHDNINEFTKSIYSAIHEESNENRKNTKFQTFVEKIKNGVRLIPRKLKSNINQL